MLLMMLDVESVGLQGEGFAVGLSVYDLVHGREVDQGFAWAHPDAAHGTTDGREWVAKHVLPHFKGSPTHESPAEVREYFWRAWRAFSSTPGGHAGLWADVAWPVEARFLSACVDAAPHDSSDDEDDHGHPTRVWSGPYPLFDVSTVLLAAGMDPKGEVPMRALDKRFFPGPLRAHHPLDDSRGSINKLVAALDRLRHPLRPLDPSARM